MGKTKDPKKIAFYKGWRKKGKTDVEMKKMWDAKNAPKEEPKKAEPQPVEPKVEEVKASG